MNSDEISELSDAKTNATSEKAIKEKTIGGELWAVFVGVGGYSLISVMGLGPGAWPTNVRFSATFQLPFIAACICALLLRLVGMFFGELKNGGRYYYRKDGHAWVRIVGVVFGGIFFAFLGWVFAALIAIPFVYKS